MATIQSEYTALPKGGAFDGKRKWLIARTSEPVTRNCHRIKIVRKFRELMENKQGDLLKEWAMEAERSGVQEIKSFSKSFLTDYEAVKNTLTLSLSNGQVEGQINKLKIVRRQMYGSAGFELLRKRMVPGSG